MAFNFNWSPLTADAGFYTRAQELLTTALNKSPKPPIIVDDILVNELNLGHVPPELEILEIGDLAEDRFRGIFKMSYNGDAFLTLKTRVQANPLNTYLLTRPSFASPQPLAAAAGLTIPLQITLSEIKLSAFIILVFSRQKGITLVFRNDPLESLKVSSTFDSIPFVRDYLQKEIEGQLRILLMDELPAIIHRLSLRLWVPEYRDREDHGIAQTDNAKDEPVVNPFASPPQDPVDSTGNALNPSEIASLSLDSGIETQSLFSHKNLLRLATLTDSHRTLSLFTPSIGEAVFRAWAGPSERGELTGLQSPAVVSTLSRTHSYTGSMGMISTPPESSIQNLRPGLQSFGPSTYGLSMGAGRHSKAHGARKRKKRVVNLRRKLDSGESELYSEEGSTVTDSASVTGSEASSQPILPIPRSVGFEEQDPNVDPLTPPTSPYSTVRMGKSVDRRPVTATGPGSPELRQTPIRRLPSSAVAGEGSRQLSQQQRVPETPVRAARQRPSHPAVDLDATPRASMILPEKVEATSTPISANTGMYTNEKSQGGPSSAPLNSHSRQPIPNFLQFITDPSNGGTIIEQAWMMKMAGEIAKRYQEEQEKGHFSRHDSEAPPAYAN